MAKLTEHNDHVGREFKFARAESPVGFRFRLGKPMNDAMGQQDETNPDRQPDKHSADEGRRQESNPTKALRVESRDVPFVADRATVLAHELNNLLDGTMRCLGIAQQSLAVEFASSEAASLDTARQQMDTVKGALERMCELVHASMMAEAVRSSTLLPGFGNRGLNDAIGHAVAVVKPGAESAGISIHEDLDTRLDGIPAGPIYSAILNALRNAVESVNRTGHAGRVEVMTRLDETNDNCAACIVIEIHDEGIGLPTDVGADELFEFGRSTKGGTGIGLGVIREIAQDMEGTVELLPRGTMGACLRMTFPFPYDESGC